MANGLSGTLTQMRVFRDYYVISTVSGALQNSKAKEDKFVWTSKRDIF